MKNKYQHTTEKKKQKNLNQIQKNKTLCVANCRQKHPMMEVQNTIGNHGLLHFQKRAIQPKLKVGQAGDKYEREADAMAQKIINKKTENISINQKVSLSAQTKDENKNNSISQALENKLSQSKGGGKPIPEPYKKEMELAFDTDFSKVRIHTDTEAGKMNTELKAQAFTHGKDVYFDIDKFQPERIEGKNLLAHELAHVVQQNGNSEKQSMIQRRCNYFPGHSSPDTYCETRREAEAIASNSANPSSCFVYRDGPLGYRWRPIPGSGGCAHYVAHELGIKNGRPHQTCMEGYSVSIFNHAHPEASITHGRTLISDLSQAQVGDIWVNASGIHSGVVRRVGSGNRAGSVRIQACGTSGNIYSSWESTGTLYREN